METVPPEMERSLAAKLVEDSEREKLSDAVSPALSEATSELIEMVGLRVSTVRVTELLASDPSALRFPEESENLDDATEITPLVVLSAVGVKVAE